MGKGPHAPAKLHQGDREALGYLQDKEDRIADLETQVSAIQSDTSTSTSLASLDTRVTALEAAVPAVYTAADQAITTSAVLGPFAHGLSTIPTKVRAFLVCQTTDAGYAVGDIVPVSTSPVDFWNSGTATHLVLGCSIAVDATNIYCVLGNVTSGVFSIINKSSAAYAFITNASWKLRISVET